MKKGGLFFAAFLLISGMLRLTSPGDAKPAQLVKEAPPKAKNEKPDNNISPIPYLEKFAAKIADFYGLDQGQSRKEGKRGQEGKEGKETDLASYFDPLPDSSFRFPGGTIQFVIAILPDPVHTRLGLFFDRSVEALQQAAQVQHYVFDRAIMPWDRTPPTQASDSKTRQEEREEQAQRESYPGLLIFRPGEGTWEQSAQTGDAKISEAAKPSSPANANPQKGPLFVLVVGETPTAGLNKQQFRNALKIIEKIREVSAPTPDPKQSPLLILGPSFSGSLESLGGELKRPSLKAISGEKFIYSGTVTGTTSMCRFRQQLGSDSHFASYQENDDFARDQFLRFVSDRGYSSREVAILSEDETVYGAPGRPSSHKPLTLSCPQPSASQNSNEQEPLQSDALKLHFPREISYFRSAYQKETAAPSSTPTTFGLSVLPLNLDENGNDDDSVAPYAVAQTSLSQEAVMLGIVSELQKHHIKFTLLLASDPLDELFLSSYLRKAYAQGHVVITVPDLLFAREGDPALRGVLALNAYSLVPGLSDRLCRQKASIHWHEDRLFVSSLSEGTFNAMAGLLAVQEQAAKGWKPLSDRNLQSPDTVAPSENKAASPSNETVPYAPYAEYGSPNRLRASNLEMGHCEERPLLWLTILGRDGFWLVAGLNNRNLQTADGQIPIVSLDSGGTPASTTETAANDPTDFHNSYGLLSLRDKWETQLATPPAWNISYCLCFILLVVHAIFSWTGTVLADSEDRAQFTRSTDWRGASVLALGAIAAASAFVLILCARSPRVDWVGSSVVTLLLWAPYPLFLGITFWDLDQLRGKRKVAFVFLGIVSVMTIFQLVIAWIPSGCFHIYWSTRILHITSGISPVLPVLLLMAAVYWWMWLSLRGVCLVDLRRPRLPAKSELFVESYRISDTEGEEIRRTAHPFYFIWQIVIPVTGLGVVSLLALGRDLPVQSVEGRAFDRVYTVMLCLIVAAFLGVLIKLVQTWQKCHQVLGGLDRIPLRCAFSRMKDLSGHSFWNPGGSTLRATYKVMNHALENLTRLLALVENWNTPIKEPARNLARRQIRKTLELRKNLGAIYSKILARETKRKHPKFNWFVRMLFWFRKDFRKGGELDELMADVEKLQVGMATTGAILMKGVLKPLWDEEEFPVVSSDDRMKKKPLPTYQAMMEEYVALIYVNFLVSVLLRIRTLVISAGGIYVFLVLSMNTYPFEPHPALQTLAVVLLLAMGGAVGYVYAGMHRETILSKLTSTEPGQLGLDFWIKFASAGAIPVFSLLAAQFPSINQFLFSWLEPALQAMK
jgi:hypothetical protein